MNGSVKPVEFRGSSLADLSKFPSVARREAGFQLFQVQEGGDPDDWKPMTDVGPGAREIRIHDEDGIFRVIYIATFQDAVYVLHCFQKKTQKTRHEDVELAKRRYKELMWDLRR